MTDRGSSQHSPRVDDELAHETEGVVRGAHETHVEEWRMSEPPADDEPMPEGVVYEDEYEFRSLLATSLRPSVFPCRRARLLGVAEEDFAPVRVVVALRALPAEQEFRTVEEVWEALGGQREAREHEPVVTTAPLPEPEEQESVPTAGKQPTPVPEPSHVPEPSLAEQAGALVGALARAACDLTTDAVRRVRSLL